MIPEKELLAIQDQLKDIEAPRMSLLRDFKMVTDECLRLRKEIYAIEGVSELSLTGVTAAQASFARELIRMCREALGK